MPEITNFQRPTVFRKNRSNGGGVPVANNFNFDLQYASDTYAVILPEGTSIPITNDGSPHNDFYINIFIDRFVCPSVIVVNVLDVDNVFELAEITMQVVPANASATAFGRFRVKTFLNPGIYEIRVTATGCNSQSKSYYIVVAGGYGYGYGYAGQAGLGEAFI